MPYTEPTGILLTQRGVTNRVMPPDNPRTLQFRNNPDNYILIRH